MEYRNLLCYRKIKGKGDKRRMSNREDRLKEGMDGMHAVLGWGMGRDGEKI